MGRPGYCTRDAVKAASDSAATARDDTQVDRAIATARDTIDSALHIAHADPQDDTRYFPWPGDIGQRTWTVPLGQQRLISLTSATADGTALTLGDLQPEPVNTGPPYTRVETDRDSSTAYSGGTSQRDIAFTGRWGLGDDQAPAGALAAALSDTTGTSVTVTNGAPVGVLSLVNVGTERMIVTAKGWADSGQNLGTNLASSTAATIVNLTSGAAFNVGESLLIDSEEMLLVGIAGNSGIVRRQWNGSTLAAHTAPADIYAARALTVERGANGSTAATHLIAAAVTVWAPPPVIESWSIAEAQCQILQEQSAYGRTVGSGEAEREAAGKGLADARKMAFARYGRFRSGAV